MTSGDQFIVPRQIEHDCSAKVILSKNKLLELTKKRNPQKLTLINNKLITITIALKLEKMKELVLVNNKPKLIKYRLEEVKSTADYGKGIKGYVTTRNGDNLVVV